MSSQDKRRKRAKKKAKARAGSTVAANQPGYENPKKAARRAMVVAANAERARLEARKAERDCGDCQLCCELKSVAKDGVEVPQDLTFEQAEAIKWKPAWTKCDHQCDAGCAIYTAIEKPSACDGYLCLWREGWGEDEDRPDRLGMLPEIAVNAAFQRIGEGETTHGQVMVFRAASTDMFTPTVVAHRDEFVGKGGTVVMVTPTAQTIHGPKCKKGITFSTEELSRLHGQALERRAATQEAAAAEADAAVEELQASQQEESE